MLAAKCMQIDRLDLGFNIQAVITRTTFCQFDCDHTLSTNSEMAAYSSTWHVSPKFSSQKKDPNEPSKFVSIYISYFESC